MKKKLIVLGMVLGTIVLSGCSVVKKYETKDKNKRFEIECEEFLSDNVNGRIRILKDKKTDKKFLIYDGCRRGGATQIN